MPVGQHTMGGMEGLVKGPNSDHLDSQIFSNRDEQQTAEKDEWEPGRVRVRGKMGDNDPDDKALSFIRVFVYSKIH